MSYTQLTQEQRYQISALLKTEQRYHRIYQYIYANKRAGGDLHKHLCCQKKRRKHTGDHNRRGKTPNQVSIEQRPENVENRERIVNWKADTIIGVWKRGGIVTLLNTNSVSSS